MNENVRLLFDNLREGLLIASSRAQQIVYANPLARRMASINVNDTIPGWLSTQVLAVQNGYLTLPFTFEITLNNVESENFLAHITVLSSPVVTDYVIILNPATATSDPLPAMSNLAEILDCEFSAPMANFVIAIAELQQQLVNLPKESLGVFSAIDSVNRNADVLKESFSTICLMSQAYKFNPIRSDERITLSLLIDDVLSNVSKLLISRHVRVSFSGVEDNVPVVYGNKVLMTQAIAGYVRELVTCVDSGTHILFSIKTNGHFVMLTLDNCGRIPPTDRGRRRLPYFPGKQPAGEDNRAELSLSMCRRVIELSGGNLRMEKSEGLLASITIELPIGAPKNKNEEYIQQAQRYAEDLASLMKQKNTHDEGALNG